MVGWGRVGGGGVGDGEGWDVGRGVGEGKGWDVGRGVGVLDEGGTGGFRRGVRQGGKGEGEGGRES